MCTGLNFTKINQKRKELISSIFARFGSVDGKEGCKKEQVLSLKEERTQRDKKVLHCAGSR